AMKSSIIFFLLIPLAFGSPVTSNGTTLQSVGIVPGDAVELKTEMRNVIRAIQTVAEIKSVGSLHATNEEPVQSRSSRSDYHTNGAELKWTKNDFTISMKKDETGTTMRDIRVESHTESFTVAVHKDGADNFTFANSNNSSTAPIEAHSGVGHDNNATTTAEPTAIDADLQKEKRDLRNSENDESSEKKPIHEHSEDHDDSTVPPTLESSIEVTDAHTENSVIHGQSEHNDGSGSEDGVSPTLDSTVLETEQQTDDAVILAKAVAGQYILRSHHDTFLRAISSGKINLSPHSKECERWFIEAHDDKVSLRPFCAPAKFIRANENGSVDLADSREEHELWTPVKRDDGSWSFQSHHSGLLSADVTGAVYTVTDMIDEWENFQLEYWTESSPSTVVGQLILKSHHETYLHAISTGVDLVPFRHLCQKWYIDSYDDKVVMKPYCAPDMYLRGNLDGSVDLSLKREADTMWKAVMRDDELWAFQSHSGGFLSADRNTSVYTVATGVDDWELFRFERWTGTGVAVDFATEQFHPPAPVILPIVGFGTGQRIRIVGMPSQNASLFAVNLRTSVGIAFHLNPRLNQACFVINSFRENSWQHELQFDDQFPFKHGNIFTIDLVAVEESIEVFINGRLFTRFQERYDTTLINSLEVVGDSPGDVHVHSVHLSMK
ncbi:hypothetical protein PENTCL1PPCAC_21358, partial [Pristionchus entomophagus]